jgi:asparagine synthase (glutamine-hydrolysing)
MCGLAGILHFDGAPVERGALRRMADALRHRGPDAEGFFEDSAAAPSIGLAHRRLSIIDLRHVADQPLGNEDGSIQAALNGEIYNFRELRAGLEGRHVFRSQGDTEVVVHLYEELGDEAVARLDGMFVLVLWDARRRRLLLARDPVGKKPLYWCADERRFAFASEIKALLAAGAPARLDERSLGESIAYGYVPTPRTLFAGIHKLPPASWLAVDASGVGTPRAYWDLRFPDDGAAEDIGLEAAAERLRATLTEAVRKRLVADVPLGVLLSGGVDSSAVAALVARLRPGRVKTFCVGFEGHAFYDERAHAEIVARHIGSEHYASVVRPQAAELVETLLHHHDEPFGDSSALPTYLVAREARRHVTVVLNGDGGDETFAGYERFQAAQLAQALPLPLLRALRAAARLLPNGRTHAGLPRRIRRFADKSALPFVERIFSWHSFFDLETLEALGRPGLIERETVLASYRAALDVWPRASLLSRLLYLNVRTYLLDDLLPKMDRMSMAHGLEARSPLLDRALMEEAARLPDQLKRRGARGKIVLKRAVADLLPPGILERRKHGFGLPIGEWFRGELRGMARDTLLARPRLGAFLRADSLERLLREHDGGTIDRGHQLWTLLTHELWLRRHGFGG